MRANDLLDDNRHLIDMDSIITQQSENCTAEPNISTNSQRKT